MLSLNLKNKKCFSRPIFIYLNGARKVFPTSTKINRLVHHVSPSQSVKVSEEWRV